MIMKNFGKLTMLLITFMSLSFNSCGSSSSDSENSNVTPNSEYSGVTPDPEVSDDMTPAEQKTYLDKVGKEVLNLMPSQDFSAIGDLAKYIRKTYIQGKSDSWSNVENWAKDCFDAASQETGITDTEEEQNSYQGYEYTYVNIYTKIYTNYNALLIASNFTGHFTYTNGKWVRSNANDLQFSFTDQNGQPCELKLTTSGNVVPVHATEISDRTGYDYDSKTVGNIYYSYSNTYYDRTKLTIGVPENIVVTLTQNGSNVVQTTVKTSLSGITNEEFDISKSSLTCSTLIELNNGYKFDLSQVAYSGNKEAAVSFTMSNRNANLVTIGLSSNISGLPSCFITNKDELGEAISDNIDAAKGEVGVQVIGKVQVKGQFTNARKFYDYMENARDNDTDESQYKSYINQANSLVDLNMYYNGSSSKQAHVKLMPFQEQKYYGKSYWMSKPVLVFKDDTSYSTLSAFFSESDFKSLMDTFKSVANQYAKLIDEKIDWD